VCIRDVFILTFACWHKFNPRKSNIFGAHWSANEVETCFHFF